MEEASTRNKAAGEGGMMTVKIGETEMEKKILFAIDEDWLARRREDPIDPAMPIIDSHHHLWDRGSRYLLEEIKGDLDASGHNVRATVFLQCDSMYRADGDPRFVPLGETEFVNGVAAMSASGIYGPARICAGIVDRSVRHQAGDVRKQFSGRQTLL
jgi:hypothetical protein